jgi:hypothetical protein
VTSRRLAAVKGIALLAVAAATPDWWVTAISLYWAARTLGPILEHHHPNPARDDQRDRKGAQR